MVGAVEVVVDGLGHAHHAALIAHLLHVLGDLVAGVHGVVAAVIEEVADVILLEDLKNPLVVGVIHIGISQLVAAGTQSGGGGVPHELQLLAVLLGHVVQLVVQNAADAVGGSQHPGDAAAVQSSLNHAQSTGIDNRGGATRLSDDASAFQFAHNFSLPFIITGFFSLRIWLIFISAEIF